MQSIQQIWFIILWVYLTSKLYYKNLRGKCNESWKPIQIFKQPRRIQIEWQHRLNITTLGLNHLLLTGASPLMRPFCSASYFHIRATYTRMHRWGNSTNSGQFNCWCPTQLLQFNTAWHHHFEHQQKSNLSSTRWLEWSQRPGNVIT